jgi:hypothetical protein
MTKKDKEGIAVMFRGFGLAFWFAGVGSLLGSAELNAWLILLLTGCGILAWSIGKYFDDSSDK